MCCWIIHLLACIANIVLHCVLFCTVQLVVLRQTVNNFLVNFMVMVVENFRHHQVGAISIFYQPYGKWTSRLVCTLLWWNANRSAFEVLSTVVAGMLNLNSKPTLP